MHRSSLTTHPTPGHQPQEHYPERCRVIIIANTPGWFSFVWKLIRPLVNEVSELVLS
jgi:hypothetical protein